MHEDRILKNKDMMHKDAIFEKKKKMMKLTKYKKKNFDHYLFTVKVTSKSLLLLSQHFDLSSNIRLSEWKFKINPLLNIQGWEICLCLVIAHFFFFFFQFSSC